MRLTWVLAGGVALAACSAGSSDTNNTYGNDTGTSSSGGVDAGSRSSSGPAMGGSSDVVMRSSSGWTVGGLSSSGMVASSSVEVADAGSADAGAEAGPGPGAFQSDFETSTQFFTLMAGMSPGTSPHGTTQIWYSSNLRSLVELPSFTAPVGSVAIKKFDNDGTPGVDGMTVMVKMPAGYDALHQDWSYEVRSPTGMVLTGRDGNLMQGALASCIACHSAAAATDYLQGTRRR